VSSPNPSVFSRRYRAFLFDMDGTLLNSIAAAERVWGIWAARHGLDVEAFLHTIHGARAIDTITRQALPGVDPQEEAQWITEAELHDVEGIVAIPGAVAFLASLPADQWALVTSAPKALAVRRLQAAGIPVPAVLGIQAGEAAGADIMVVTSTHLAPMVTAHACIEEYGALKALRGADGLLSLSRLAP